MNMFEGAARVPLMICAPELAPGLVHVPVSTIDLCPTLCALAGVSMTEVMPWTDGVNLLPVARGADRGIVAMEYAAEGTITPMVALREGVWKYVACAADAEMLFDLGGDPQELVNRAADPGCAGQIALFRGEVAARWDLARFDSAVRESQARRRVVYQALRQGGYYPWDYQPLRQAAER